MTVYNANRIKQTVTGSGTGTLTLGAAETGYRACTTDFVSNLRFRALIEQGNEWEISQVSHNGSGTLTRHLCLQSSNANAFVSFPSGDKTLSFVALAVPILDTVPSSATHDSDAGYCRGDIVLAPTPEDPTSNSGTLAAYIAVDVTPTYSLWVPLPRFGSEGDDPGDVGLQLTGRYNSPVPRGVAVGVGGMSLANNDCVAIGGGYAFTVGVEKVRATTNIITLSARTSDATETQLGHNFGASLDTILVWDGPTRISAKVVAFEPATGDTKEWTVEALARHTQGYAALDLIGTPTVTSAFASAGAAAWSVAVAVDFANSRLELNVTGEAAHDIVWAATVIATGIDYTNLA